MNKKIIQHYINEYKKNFELIHHHEIYKWKAVKHFQDNFDIDSNDFYENLKTALGKVGNLLVSGNYYPKNMLIENADVTPEKVRELLINLYDEDEDILSRVDNFQKEFGELNESNFPGTNHYQDHRAIIVYMVLNYPERYFLYKYTMFKNFREKIDYAYRPIAGRLENIGKYHNLCELLRYEISKDQELIALHQKRLTNECYRDKNLNILTQDFIYAVVRHLRDLDEEKESKEVSVSVIEKKSNELNNNAQEIDFSPKTINHIQNTIKNKRIGDLGELLVCDLEYKYLIESGKAKLAEEIQHVSKEKGDGLGYDILSYDLKGNEKYIEVKTTKGNASSTFYITRNELRRSEIEQDNYFLYRVYDFDEENQNAKVMKIQGVLTSICDCPINYRINLDNASTQAT